MLRYFKTANQVTFQYSMSKNNEQSEIQSISSHRYVIDKNNNRVREYKVLWKGPTLSNYTWQTAQNLKKFKNQVEKYNRNNPQSADSSKVVSYKETEQQSKDWDYNKWRGARKNDIPRGINGRPPKNHPQRPYHGPDKQVIVKSNKKDIKKNQPELKSDVRSEQQRNNKSIKVKGLFQEMYTQKIYYKIEQNNSLTYRTRQWVMNRNKLALIQFYQSCIKIQK